MKAEDMKKLADRAEIACQFLAVKCENWLREFDREIARTEISKIRELINAAKNEDNPK